MACCKPPPGLAMSRKKRTASSKFDFPDALGPTMNTRSVRPISTDRKFRQFFNINRDMITERFYSLSIRSRQFRFLQPPQRLNSFCAKLKKPGRYGWDDSRDSKAFFRG